ncbi:MAG: exodeoxyribonuclease VII small subunit [Parcubacteria group bacterium]|nr:exodeoxyribonuclease VII small subunit [Parcubacteria group bacterium]
MPAFKIPTFVVLSLVVFASAVGGSYVVFKQQFASSLEERAAAAFAEGNYAAALRYYSELNESTPEDEGVAVAEKAAESKNLLVAEEILKKAQEAAAEGDWFEVKALLQKGDVSLNTSFKEYKQAIELYVEASDKVKELEKKIETELGDLRDEALSEKTKRKEVERQAEETKEELQTTIAKNEKREAELKQEIQVTTAGKAEAEKKAAEERLQKFLNETELYLGMLEKGATKLSEAVDEINKDKDSTALALLNQAKTLFDEVNDRAEELLNNRTEEAHKDEVQKLLQATAIFITSSRNIGTAVFYLDQKTGTEFTTFLKNGIEGKNSGLSIVGSLKSFVVSLR